MYHIGEEAPFIIRERSDMDPVKNSYATSWSVFADRPEIGS